MPKDNTTADTNANKVFDMPVSLKAGEVNTLSFAQDSIKSMNLTADNHLEISFRDGSKIEVENFQELVNSAQSCGRDTIIQLSDNTIIYPEELNTQLSQGPVNFNSGTMASGEGSDDGSFSISMPRAGQVIERDISEGSTYKLGFAMGDAISAAQAGQNLILTFNDGGVLVLKNYFPATAAADPAQFSFNNGEAVDTASLMSSCKLAAIPTVAESVAENAPAQGNIAMVEPAAGEEVTEKAARVAKKSSIKNNIAEIEPAGGNDTPQKVAQKAPQDPGVQDIEPAAGDSGAQLISGNRGGFGFASTLQDATFATSNAIGPIGPTALGYQAPDFPLGQIRGTATPLTVVPPGPVPAITPSVTGVDETNFATVGGNTNNGTVTGTNGPVVFSFNDGFGISGSVAGGRLTSCGDAVTVSREGNVFTGKLPNGDTVFTITLNANGTYNYVQSKPLDHADASNPDDVLTLTFGVTGTNGNGSGTSFISVNVRDDGPVAVNDGATVGSAPLVVTGNILTNDKAGQDGGMKLVSFTFEGVTKQFVNGQPVSFETTRGNITVNENGSYTYTSKNTVLGTDEFSYVIRDCDGDTSTAKLTVAVTDLDTTPIFIGSAAQIVDDTNLLGGAGTNIVNGNVPFDFKADAPGVITANGQFSSNGDRANNALTSNGVPVDVAFNAQTNTWTGTAAGQPVFTMVVRADGTYTFTQQAQLDHSIADTQTDKINLVFGVTGTDSDGDTAGGTVTITVLDDAPIARDDGSSVTTPGGTVNGNVITNDTMSKDVTTLKSVTVNGVTTAVASTGETTVQGAFGVLKIQANGTYTYTADPAKGGKDTFTYTLVDRDGDTSSAKLDITTVQRPDGVPVISGSETVIDETNYTFGTTVNGTYSFNYGTDGQGATGSITSAYVGAEGSVPNGGLRSGGAPVSVAQVGNTYIGTANGVEVFRAVINTNGTYTYTQSRPFDHANTNDPNDQLALRFRLTITDADGDRDSDTNGNNDIVIKVLDDAPIANNDGSYNVASGATIVGASSLLANDTVSKDGGTSVREIKFGNQTVQVPTTGETTINGAFGVLTIRADGTYSYRAGTASGGADTFTYVIRDADGDQSQANITFNAAAPTPFGVTLETCDVVVWEDSFCYLHFVARPTGGDGDEVITVKLEGIPAGWRLELNGTNYTPVNGVVTFTGAAGQKFDGNNIKIYPPANSDVDIPNVRVTATIFDPDTNTTSAPVVNNFKVITNADADVPNLSLSVGAVSNGQANVNIQTSLNDTDGSERITVVRIATLDANGNYAALPVGITFNKGIPVYNGGYIVEWKFTNLADLQGLTMNVPNGTGHFKLAVISDVTEVNARANGNEHVGDDLYLYNYAIVSADVNTSHSSGVTATAISGGDHGNTATATTGGDGGVTATAISGFGLIGDHTIALPEVVHFDNPVLPTIQGVSYFDEPYNQPNNQPIITNFNAAQGDTLDISNVISLESGVDLAINDFVYANSTVEGVKISAGGNDMATLQGVDNVNVNDIMTISQINQNNGQV